MKLRHQTKEFWLAVRKEFKKSERRFMCLGSPIFARAWKCKYEKEGIRKLAIEWSAKSKKWKKHESCVCVPNWEDHTCLFASLDFEFQIRMTFLNAMVKKFS